MKFIQEKIDEYRWYADDVTLNNMHRSKKFCKRGLVICYLLAIYEKWEKFDLRIEFDKELGAIEEKVYIYKNKNLQNKYKNFEEFYKIFDNEEFNVWEINCMYMGNKLNISGTDVATEVSIMYLKECDMDVKTLMESIERESYNYNEFDKDLIEYVRNEDNCSFVEAIKRLEVIAFDDDIYEEFKRYIDGKENTKINISECGVTAKTLIDVKKFKPSYAYEILYELRHEPENGLNKLKRNKS